MSNILQHEIVHSKNINSVPICNGRIIKTYDTYEQYFDYNDKRHKICDIITVDTYNDLKKIPNPIVGKFYYVKDEELAQLYYFTGEKFIKTSGYTHPIYTVKPGSYRCVKVNQMGHVTEANNDILPVELGGTGVNSLDDLATNMNMASKDDINELKENISSGSQDISSLDEKINNTNDKIDNYVNEINTAINELESNTNNSLDSLQDQIDGVVNSYYIRDASVSDWIFDSTDNTYYIMMLKSTYGLKETFPITSIYVKNDNEYNMSHGIFDNKDYTISVDNDLNVTIKTTNPFECKIIINTI